MSITLSISPTEQYTIHHQDPTLQVLIEFCQRIWPTVLPCQLFFFIDKQLIQPDTDIHIGSEVQLEIRDLIELEWVPLEQLLQTRLLCSKRSWINYSREYECFEVYSLHPKTESLRRALYYTDINGLPSYYCTPTYIQRKRILKQLLT